MKICRDIAANGTATVDDVTRRLLAVRGLVQGVGFRPFVYRLAADLGLTGWVRNTTTGVQVEIQGSSHRLEEFLDRFSQEQPPHVHIDDLKIETIPPAGDTSFKVKPSCTGNRKSALVLPDIASCKECVKEIFDPRNRRFRYPFTNCTQCGPRFSIIEALPYDRSNTTMKAFQLCDRCRQEYEDPLNRRFHAQPTACHDCGPHLELWNRQGDTLATHDDALLEACSSIARGQIVALKGLGGFQLIVDARNVDAVYCLRQRKERPDKPLALMYPDLDTVRTHCEVSAPEESLLCSPESPIVLLKCRAGTDDTPLLVSPNVAPDNPCLGIMLPYTPLHYLLMAELGFPVVATSGNLRDEPICTDEYDALRRLESIADLFLVHNRPIARHMDDSIVQLVANRCLVLRNARGYAPTAIPATDSGAQRLAVGGHLKNSVALSNGDHIIVSQYIGNLTTKQAEDSFNRTIEFMTNLFDLCPGEVSCDEHPDYRSSRFAADLGLPLNRVQHHYAHVLSCMAENDLCAPVLGIAWDGTGLGSDGTVWGGEFLHIDEGSFSRFAHLRTFPLPGNEKAIEEPRRSALGLLYEVFGQEVWTMRGLKPLRAFAHNEKSILATMLEQNINTPRTSSVGRMFDAVASIVGLRQIATFEGQASMSLQSAACEMTSDEYYEYAVDIATPSYILDWSPMIHSILDDLQHSVPIDLIAVRFHNTLAAMIVDIAERVAESRVVLTGGCFQNKYLLGRTISALQTGGFEPFWHRKIPPNDSGIALGQIIAASNRSSGGA